MTKVVPAPQPPETLSALVRLALEDNRRLDRTVYKPSAGVWHQPVPWGEEMCAVCFAGGVMAGTLGARRWLEYRPTSSAFDEVWVRPLKALDSMRLGLYREAAEQFYGMDRAETLPEALEDFEDGNDYDDFESWEEFDGFLAVMEKAATWLEELGV